MQTLSLDSSDSCEKPYPNGISSDAISLSSIEDWFVQGNYTSVAMAGVSDLWQTYAAYGLIGKTDAAIEGLQRFTHADARFYLATAYWIGGQDQQAISILQNLDNAFAKNLLRLILKPCIEVLGQLMWRRGGSQDLVSGALADSKFLIRNLSFHPEDTPYGPYEDVHSLYDQQNSPDFYICQMAEWHVIPPNIQELPCPIFGQSADYDLHIQAVYPWLCMFDEMLVTDGTEWQDIKQLVSVPVSTFPKSFGLPDSLPPPPIDGRALDVFWSGTITHPYHPDKARLIQSVFNTPGIKTLMVNGFLPKAEYFTMLGKTKAVFTFYRHSGGMVTRGLEALAMGCGLVVQKNSVLKLFAGEEHGVLTYENAEELSKAINRIVAAWPDFEQRAQSGAQHIRNEFGLPKVASQYLRFLTVLAAKPRPLRTTMRSRHQPNQKRSVLCKGALPDIHQRRYELMEGNIDHWIPQLRQASTVHSFIDMARELVLWGFSISDVSEYESFFRQAFDLYRLGLKRFPDSLVLRVNFIRVALYFGGETEVSDALKLAEETVLCEQSSWVVDPLEDVLFYYSGDSFHYCQCSVFL
ncbi:MAG: glycosyltransferase family protein, partial [Nitrospirales bacterium]